MQAGPGSVSLAVKRDGTLAALLTGPTSSTDEDVMPQLRGRLGSGAELGVDQRGITRGVVNALIAYLADPARGLDWPASPVVGTAYQLAVWAETRRIRSGAVVGYGALADAVGGSPRSVGAALGANPLHLLCPCHRVVAANGALTGYAGGMEWKRWLLRREGVRLDPSEGKVLC